MKSGAAIFFMCLVFSVSSCITLDLRDSPNAIDETKEGVLFAVIVTDVPGARISLYPRNTAKESGPFSSAAAVFDRGRLHTGGNFIFIKLPAGRYMFKYVYYKNNLNVFELEDAVFDVKAGSINYAGSLRLSPYEKDGKTAFACKYTDDYADHESFLDAERPVMKAHYPVRKSVLVVKQVAQFFRLKPALALQNYVFLMVVVQKLRFLNNAIVLQAVAARGFSP
ncbi:MAG: hypothetical protein LBF60_05780 [Treponema sp.]|jgi:hypothetical protein|nr:hypothetical protein [Treponema sp.]